MDFKATLHQVMAGQSLDHHQMQQLMRAIMQGELNEAQIAGILVALRIKGESLMEIQAAVEVMRELSTQVHLKNTQHLVDIVGTGGDGQNTFNVSTASMFVAAAAGARVAKHGNRSVSSKSGSADLLEIAGAKLDLSPEKLSDMIDVLGVGFMFAPLHHSAMKYVVPARRALGVRTIFNLLGPLTNPANAQNLVLGVYDESLLETYTQVLKALGAQHVMVVHSQEGLDEISIAQPTSVAELQDGHIRYYKIHPSHFDFHHKDLSAIQVESAAQSLTLIQQVFEGEKIPARDMILLNAGAAIYVAGLTKDYDTGVAKAAAMIDSGMALAKFRAYIEETQRV